MPSHSVNWGVLAPVLVACAGVCWGLISLFSQTLAAAGLDSFQIAATRCVLTCAGSAVYALVRARDAFRIRIRDIWMFLGTGVASIALFNTCYFASIAANGVSLAAMLLYTAPFFVVVLSALLFGEALTRVKLVALVVAFAGCLLVVGVGSDGAGVTLAGVLVGLGSGIGYALYSIFGRFALRRYGAPTLLFYTFLFASLALMPFAHPVQLVCCIASSSRSVGAALALSFLSTLAPFACYTLGLAHMDTGTASIMAFIEPMVSLLVGVCHFGETLTSGNIAGIVCIAAAVLLLNARLPQLRKRRE